ncbi:NS protein [Campana virus]|uniref:NS protein n=2 Tax=Phlebovirus TaxID=11584 RepID=A0A0F6ZNF3_9VIRU|nr:NS protein [Campana virus]ABQ23571.1 nonstructural protein [Phlebovirus sp. VP-334K]AKF42391.1 NS protein [Campana virus]
MYKNNNYALQIPCISSSVGPLSRQSVQYIPFNKQYHCPVSNYRGLEVPVHNLKQSSDVKSKLSGFFKDYQIPHMWGSSYSQVTQYSPVFFDVTIERISELSIETCLRWCEPNIKKALSWPLGYPSLKFFYHSNIDSYSLNWCKKCDFATQLLRIGGGLGLDDSLFFTYSKILSELSLRQIPSEVFSGYNISKEIAYVQILRMLTALEFDLSDDCCQSPLFHILLSQKTVISDQILGNKKWKKVVRDNQIQSLPNGGEGFVRDED